jgi:hypothetical protein
VRLASLDTGHGPRSRAFLGLVGIGREDGPPDVLKMLSYRPGFFGTEFSKSIDALLRGPSDWSVGERELFAAYASYLNQCHF